jgi:hypothetical protein
MFLLSLAICSLLQRFYPIVNVRSGKNVEGKISPGSAFTKKPGFLKAFCMSFLQAKRSILLTMNLVVVRKPMVFIIFYLLKILFWLEEEE